MQEMTMMQAIRAHLLLPGETLKIEEYKKLTDQDKADLISEFAKIGVTVVASK